LSFARDVTEPAPILHVFGSLPWIALLFAVLAVPALLGLRHLHAEPTKTENLHPCRWVLGTLRAWRSHREELRFLLGAYLINDAILTTIFFIAIDLRDDFHMTMTGQIWLALLYHVITIPAAVLFGMLEQRTSTHLALHASLARWSAAIIVMGFGKGQAAGIAVVVVFATVLGSSQALLHGSFSRLFPPNQAAEYFGFN
jgi:MFS-type transporter involved in bile tolerance (Atg22 family)